MIALIAAVANGNVIGYQGQIPWGRIPCDLRYFKELTMNCPIVMGYNTLVSVSKIFPHGKIFPGRVPFVLAKEPRKVKMLGIDYIAMQNTDLVFELAKMECVFIIGGEKVYQQFIDKADIAYITRISADFKGDAFFPQFPNKDWGMLSSEPAHDSGYNLIFETWARGYKKPPMTQGELMSISGPDTQKHELITRLR